MVRAKWLFVKGTGCEKIKDIGRALFIVFETICYALCLKDKVKL